MSQTEPQTKTCSLKLGAFGEVEPCSEEECAFWEPGGAVVPGECFIERLGIDVQSPGLAEYLLETCKRLEQARDLAAAEAAHREFSRRLGRDV
jgi:hypothetical protein